MHLSAACARDLCPKKGKMRREPRRKERGEENSYTSARFLNLIASVILAFSAISFFRVSSSGLLNVLSVPYLSRSAGHYWERERERERVCVYVRRLFGCTG